MSGKSFLAFWRTSPLIASARALLLLLAMATATRAQSVQLFWDAPEGNSNVSYRIEGGTVSGAYSASYPIGVGVTSFSVTGLVAGVRYYFVVRAIDATGLQSAPSNEVSVVAGGDAAEPPAAGSTEQPPVT